MMIEPKCKMCQDKGTIESLATDEILPCPACSVSASAPESKPPVQLHEHEDVAITRLGEKIGKLIHGIDAKGIPFVSIIGLLFVKQLELHADLLLSYMPEEDD